ncbi:MAG: hypothetical protein Q8N17_25925 [Burkholderiaceae bacterium]|nr:hypothetical protein [Burkholderiaceae bacterium]
MVLTQDGFPYLLGEAVKLFARHPGGRVSAGQAVKNLAMDDRTRLEPAPSTKAEE